jgi:hypothetical protein
MVTFIIFKEPDAAARGRKFDRPKLNPARKLRYQQFTKRLLA